MGGNEIPGLTAPITVQFRLTDADYQGLFGVLEEAASAVSRKTGYLQYPENALAPTTRKPVDKSMH